MKKSILLKGFALSLLLSSAAFAVNDNVTSTVYNTPQAGSLTSNQEANNNSASNNGMIGTSSSATANTLHSDITGIQRFDTSNNQLGNSYSTSSLGNISNNSAGGAGGSASSSSGGNSLNNSLSNNLSSNSGGNTLSNGQGQSSANTNSSAGNNTNINSTSTTTVERTAPPLFSNNITPVNNNGYNLGVTTIMGGFQGGISKVDKSAKALNFSQSAFIDEQKTEQLIKNTERACVLVSSDECSKLKTQMLRKMGIVTKTANNIRK